MLTCIIVQIEHLERVFANSDNSVMEISSCYRFLCSKTSSTLHKDRINYLLLTYLSYSFVMFAASKTT